MKYIISVGIALQLVAAIMPAVRAETASPMPQSPTQSTAPHDPKARPAASNRAQADLEQRTSTKPDSVKRSSERDRLILERFLIKVIPPASH